jgi:hypothetical protein
MTYFTSLNFTNYTLVTDWYVAGNEIADHTYVPYSSQSWLIDRCRPHRMTHVGDPPDEEINGNLITLNALAGIPLTAIKGFRAPFLNYSAETFRILGRSAFTYDSSTAASVPVTDPNTDAYWPYTLDNGLANNCLRVAGTCKGEPKVPGLWEIPMYALFDERGVQGPHLMNLWLYVVISLSYFFLAVSTILALEIHCLVRPHRTTPPHCGTCRIRSRLITLATGNLLGFICTLSIFRCALP